jgi:protein-S-isoprenylcysteine O-methyltransferase Ste14
VSGRRGGPVTERKANLAKALCGLLWVTLFTLAYGTAVQMGSAAFEGRLITSTAFCVLAGALGYTYCSIHPHPASWARCVAGAAMFLLLGSLLFSVVRHDFILIPFPFLFCLPGAALGGAWALSLAGHAPGRTELEEDRLPHPSVEAGEG